MFRRFLIGTATLSSVRIFRLLAQGVAIPLLARLLSPEEYGLMALAMPFALFAMMLADAGIGMSLVRVDAADRVTWSTAFWISCLLGLVLTLLMAALGPVAAYLFQAPALAPMITVLSLVVLAQAVHLIPVAALQQAGRFHIVAVNDLFGTVIGIATALMMASHGYGAWALVGQQVAYFSVRLSMTCLRSPFRPIRAFEWGAMREHITFGRALLATNLIAYAGRNLDSWVVGRILGATLLGHYALAFQFARLPAQLITGPLQFVMYAELTKMKDQPREIGQLFLYITRVLATVLLPIMGMIAVAHAPVFTLVLSSKWQVAGHLFMQLAGICALQAIATVGETVVYALGRADIQLRNTGEYTLLWLGALVLTISHGLTAAALAYSLSTTLYLTRYLHRVLPLMELSIAEYLATLTRPLLASAGGIACYLVLSSEFTLTPLTQALCALVLALAAMALCAPRQIFQRAFLSGFDRGLVEGVDTHQRGGEDGFKREMHQ